ncbi:MAG TPA: PQQ-binding-like beta-propeller repeat protein [Pirellulales bacterium]|nr:PQQ-binding-like beta-propeller repeat protein [Pirellulales bacterium]
MIIHQLAFKHMQVSTFNHAGPAAILLTVALAGICRAAAAEVSYFRHDGGTVDGKKLPDKLDDRTQKWRVPLAAGHSTPCIYGDAIYLTTFDGRQLATVALDRQSGKTRWTQAAPASRIEEYHATSSPAAATPACDGQRIYVFFGSYGLLCYDLEGHLAWSRELGPFQDEFGAASSPILVEGKLVISADHDTYSFVMALDPATGKTLWKTDRPGFTRSYSTPVPFTIGGRQQIIVAGALQLVAYDADNGEKLWWVNGLARIVNPTPAQALGLVFVATWSPGGDTDARLAMDPWKAAVKKWDADGDGKLSREEVSDPEVLDRFFRIDLNQDKLLDEPEWAKYARVFELAQNTLLAIRPGGSGDVTEHAVVWEYRKGLPYVPSPVVYRDVLYMVKNGGILTTLKAADGRVLKQLRLPSNEGYYASPVAGDGKIYVASEPGVVAVIGAGPAASVISSHDFGERTMATPVIADGHIYLRTEKALYCFAPL